MTLDNFIKNKILIWGLGQEGQAAARFLIKKNKQVDLYFLDQNNQTQLASDLNNYPIFNNYLDPKLKEMDWIIKSPGISLYNPEVKYFLDHGIKITSGSQLWFDENQQAKTICVTGTKGKSTCSSLIWHLLNQAKFKAELCGNIGLPLLATKTEQDFYVIELSSYQIADLKITPSLRVLLNLYPEHLDWHKSTENYYSDKLKLFKSPGPITIVNQEFSSYVSESNYFEFNSNSGIKIIDNKLYFQNQYFCELPNLKLIGKHNLRNIEAALTVIKILNLDLAQAVKNLASFEPLAHRLSFIGEFNKLTYIDDSISTIPEASIAALSALGEQQITLLAGGFERNQSWLELAKYIKQRSNCQVICLPDNGNRLFTELTKLKIPAFNVENLSAGMELAKKITPAEGIVLLSPGAPSYGSFKNYIERGLEFKKLAIT